MRVFILADEEADTLAIEFGYGIDVVVVTVGDKDAGQRQTFFSQDFTDAFGVPGGIDHKGFVALAVGEDVNEVVMAFDDEGDDVVHGGSQWIFMRRSFCRDQSRSFSLARLSKAFLPLAMARFTLT